MKMKWRLGPLLAVIVPLCAGGYEAPSAGPDRTLHVTPVVDQGTVRLVLRSSVPFDYHASRATAGLYVVDLFGVSVAGDEAKLLDSQIVPSYRMTMARTAGEAVARVEAVISDRAEAHMERSSREEVTMVVTEAGAPSSLLATVGGPKLHAQEDWALEAKAEGHVEAPGKQGGGAAVAGAAARAPGMQSGAGGGGATSMSNAPAAGKKMSETSETEGAGLQNARYTGEPISVNLKDVDLTDFFRLIHDISGLNVVIDPNVKGTVSLVLDDVPWDQALDIVLHNNDLDKQLEGNVLRIATKETLQKEAEQDSQLAKAQSGVANLVTVTRPLNYAKSDDLVNTLKKFLTARGQVFSDPRSNALIIQDVPEAIPALDKVIKQLDHKSQQVEIEARVVAANRTFSREIGTMFGFAAANAGRSNFVGGVPTVGLSPLQRGVASPLPIPPLVGSGTSAGSTGPMLPLNTNLGPSVPTSGISYQFSSANFALDLIIAAAESKGEGKLLSKPRVATQNNTKATVKQGVKVPIQTIINNTISVEYIDAVLELEVTPQITPEGTVFMDVHVENTQIDTAIPRVTGIPALDTESADTRILVQDGQTVVVGGIIISSQQTNIDQVPLFGSLPVIGNLFRHTTVITSSQELLFFLTPRILPS